MNIVISHFHRYSGPDAIYLGRGTANAKYPLLANDYSHKNNTKATYKVDTVIEAVEKFDEDLVYFVKQDIDYYREQLRALFEESLEKNTRYGRVVYLCWCQDELNPRVHDHACHCEVLRRIVNTKYQHTIRNQTVNL